MSVLVTGGSGYIGSHVARLLEQRGERVVIVDHHAPNSEMAFRQIDLAGSEATAELVQLMQDENVHAVIHLAAKKQVGESVERPIWYYQQNVGGLGNLLAAMEHVGVHKLVFSSSAAVYGEPVSGLAQEDSPTVPINPYGQTKLIGEWLVSAAARSNGLKHISLRYFNVAGSGWDDLADPFALNLIPIILHRLDRGDMPVVFGDQYDTPDGTCIRDYVHVLDLAEAHLSALDALDSPERQHSIFNIGTGTGTSVLEVVDAISGAIGRKLEPIIAAARAGDPPRLTADVNRAAQELNWTARYGLAEIVDSAWRAHQHRSEGLNPRR
ncbi:MAG: UDP-glucose 4-epimerase GalE [Microbacteriaceae bacterium]